MIRIRRQLQILPMRVASVAESKLKEITGMQAIKIYEEAAVPEKPSSPSLKKNCALGLLAGIVSGYGSHYSTLFDG